MKEKVEIHLDLALNAVVIKTTRPRAGDGVILDVTLNDAATPPYLDVDDEDEANFIEKHPDTQAVRWRLSGNAAGGTFNELTDPEPGFKWIKPAPPAGVFSHVRLSRNKKEILIDDLNDGAASVGLWYYQLNATIGGVSYMSRKEPFPPSPSVTTNASIKNK